MNPEFDSDLLNSVAAAGGVLLVRRSIVVRKCARTGYLVLEMADADSSDFTFCKVSSAENDDQLGSPKAIPVASMTLEDVRGDNASISKKNEMHTNDSDKDGKSSSISDRIASVSLQDCNLKEPVIQTIKGANQMFHLSQKCH
uniref:Uncharacterized protein n=1 Tax=Arundo donax TaxID=35708 RepID=A0A0A9CS14_ARUDO